MSHDTPNSHRHVREPNLAAAMVRFSENCIAKVSHCLTGNPCKNDARSGRDNASGLVDIIFYMADVRRLLSLYAAAAACPSFASLLRSPVNRRFETFLAHDEVTAGNVLNPMQRMKALLVYFTIKPLSAYFETAKAWMPLTAGPHEQVQSCLGGLNAITACIVEEWLN